jgi:hypothetical protein
LNIAARFGADFFKEDLVLFSKLLALLLRNVSLFEIDLIGQKCNDNSVASLVLHVINPFLDAFEGVAISDVVDDNGDRSVSNVVRDESLEAFLSGRIPQLQTDGLVLEEDVLRNEVDSDGGTLDGRMRTCSLPSKMS